MKLVPDPGNIRLAMLGMIPGNGHPYSWSAIINGYDRAVMASCPYPVIAQYLNAQPEGTVGIDGVQVTHVWTDNPDDASHVAAAAKIPHIVSQPEEVIGKVDAVVIATDDGDDHVRRAEPFVKAGLPVFIDKPLAVNTPDLRRFLAWSKEGRPILSSSGLRYAPEIQSACKQRESLGELRWISSVTCKTWERYAIHALEAIFPLIGRGILSVRMNSQGDSHLATLRHRTGTLLTLAVLPDAFGSFGAIHLYGTKGHLAVTLKDTYTAFRTQLQTFVEYLRTGVSPFPFEETVELMAILIGGIRSRQQDGREIYIEEILQE